MISYILVYKRVLVLRLNKKGATSAPYARQAVLADGTLATTRMNDTA